MKKTKMKEYTLERVGRRSFYGFKYCDDGLPELVSAIFLIQARSLSAQRISRLPH
jgi:hypothetical protein